MLSSWSQPWSMSEIIERDDDQQEHDEERPQPRSGTLVITTVSNRMTQNTGPIQG